MKKETIYIRQKVILEYDTAEERKIAIESLKKWPNTKSIGCGLYRWAKADTPIRIIVQKRTPIK